ncbi:hypothetical protein K6119_09765 [Paracrocinitomix mangrovi]|uniref:hypothetical protein n=1 Tax=Paracrocinitomix mangrovi TaxID=2862509 RepID=UPI001C8D53C8|nr:hypothetical protein [Paracrocinitomix mangrovi]UKN03776.1 hypothetical protein K6119_09765 [Paracrocinitomix mangrovi]
MLVSTVCFGQDFELKYASYGLGSNLGRAPSNRIYLKNHDLEYTYQIETDSINFIEFEGTEFEDTFYVSKDTSLIIQIDQNDLDSISSLFKGLENTEISYSNMYVRSGACYELKVKADKGCTSIVMYNNFDSTVFKVVTILNRYLPEKLQIYIPESTWQAARERSRPGMDLTAGRKSQYNCFKWND